MRPSLVLRYFPFVIPQAAAGRPLLVPIILLQNFDLFIHDDFSLLNTAKEMQHGYCGVPGPVLALGSWLISSLRDQVLVEHSALLDPLKPLVVARCLAVLTTHSHNRF